MVYGELIPITGAGGSPGAGEAGPGLYAIPDGCTRDADEISGAGGVSADGESLRDYAAFFDDCLLIGEALKTPFPCTAVAAEYAACFEDAIFVCFEGKWQTHDCEGQGLAMELCSAYGP
jgi:hypothetical protein